jgi:uncharacterized protein YjiS (DUF1127 family)
MSHSETSRGIGRIEKMPRLLSLLMTMMPTRRRHLTLDDVAMSDHLLHDIGISPHYRNSDLRDINMMDATIRSGILLPRPC